MTEVVAVDAGVNITVTTANATTFEGVNKTYTLTVNNTGNAEDTFALLVTEIDSVDTAALNMSSITLASGAVGTVLLNVTNTTAGIFNVTVNATSQANGSVVDTTRCIMTTVTAASPNTNIVSIANVTLPYGSTQTIPILLLNSTGVGAGQVILTFNESIVNTTNVVAGDFDSVFLVDYSNVSNGTLRITSMEAGANLTGDRTIATVTLHAVNASGSCELGLYAELSDKVGTPVPSNVSNGTFTINTTAATTPPAPVSLQSTTGKYWVNYTWEAGSIGPDTDSYNVSLDNGSWYNRTTTSLNVTGLGAEGWANITVWAYNETGSGNMSVSSVSDEVQAPADTVNISISLNGGWNLIAIPVYPLNNTVASVFAGVNMFGASVYKYTPSGYQVVTTVEPKVGYWVYSLGSATIWVEGTAVTS